MVDNIGKEDGIFEEPSLIAEPSQKAAKGDLKFKRAKRVPLNMEHFPTTRFYGSKRKQLTWLHEALQEIPGDSVLDGFGGTGTVSLLFQCMGRNVTFNDVFKFNEISVRALGSRATLDYSEAKLRQFIKAVVPTKGFISKTFDGIYFQEEENEWLDGFMLKLHRSTLPGSVKEVLQYCLFQACLKKRPFNLFHRANLYLRNSDMEVSFGNRSTWARSFENHMLEAYGELATAHEGNRAAMAVLPSAPIESVRGDFDIVYLDPPYFKANGYTEPYLLRYHFLEGLARYNEWPSLVDLSSPIRMFRKEAFPKEWSSKANFFKNLQDLIAHHRHSTVVLSYVENSYPSEYALTKYFKSVFRQVTKKRRTYGRALSSKNRNEIILIGRP